MRHDDPSSIPKGSSRGRRILVVDDDLAYQEMFKLLLGERGYWVDTASTGAIALARVAVECPKLVISDLRLPDMSGFRVLQRLKQTYPMVRVMIISAVKPWPEVEALADACVSKPFELADVLALTRRLCSCTQ